VWNLDPADCQDERLHRGSPRQLWEPIAGAPLLWGLDERINDAGYRGPELPLAKTPGRLRIATLGDSSTFGFGVAFADTWSARLIDELSARGVAAEVLDAGVIGSTIEQGLERYDQLVRARRPDVVVAAFGAVNEAFDSPKGCDRDRIEARNRALAPRDLLDRARRDSRAVQLAAWIADCARGEPSKTEQRYARRQARALTRDLEIGRVDWPGTRRVRPQRFEQCVAELAERVRSDGARLVLVSMPREPSNERDWPVLPLYSESLARAAASLALPLYDFRGEIARGLAAGREWKELFLDACHPTPAGHALLARELAPYVADAASVPAR
jgi:lysophospholipase L1-like esterase